MSCLIPANEFWFSFSLQRLGYIMYMEFFSGDIIECNLNVAITSLMPYHIKRCARIGFKCFNFHEEQSF